MHDVFDVTDELGPDKVIHISKPAAGLKAILVVDNVAAGPAIGGARMAPDVTLSECARLARAMTLKNAAAGLPHGGGKSVVFGDPRMPSPQKERLIRAFAQAIGQIEDYIVGPDMGTDERCMAWAKDEIGRAVGLPREIGGIPLDEIGATGFGLAVAAAAAEDPSGVKLDGARVAVQGFGAVGYHAARFLAEHGARLVAASDSKGCISNSSGLDIAALAQIKSSGGSVVDLGKGDMSDRDAIIAADCDILIPAARPDAIREDNTGAIRARLILEGANIPATEAAERRLHGRGVTVIPDFIANAGGVICASIEYHGGSESQAFAAIEEKIARNTTEVLARTKSAGMTPRGAADALAQERVRTAQHLRRFG
ncbi:MAG: Glu/Leu/Phe/Val dehydrogenase [Paracoccaceae bacterium]|nr:Glu/Leu/Phe/Val dehydrogenase [Paracoccaceae bacterium]